MNQENKLPTAETILKQEFYGDEWEELMSNLNSDITPSVVSAMEEHTRLRIADYKRRTEERMIELETELEKLRAENEKLKAVNISLEKTIENMAYLEMDTDRQSGQLIIENAQYKEALELVKLDLEERGKEYWDIYKIAKEALKEDNIDTCKKCGYPLFKMHHENKIRCHGCDNIIELKGNE